jgi:hypothetical protein
MVVKIKNFIFFLFFVSFFSCGVSLKHWERVERLMRQENYDQALEYIDKHKNSEYGDKNQVLYYLDKGIVLHHMGNYKESNMCLEKAEDLIDELYTKSITSEASSLAINDNLLPYQGEDFENALINVFGALNYIYLNKIEDALVEGRKVDHKLKILSDRYDAENKKLKQDEKRVQIAYTEDAFARYLMGLIFEEENEINDSFIFYRNSLETYKNYEQFYQTLIPQLVPQDLLKTANYMGFDDEFEKYKKYYPDYEKDALQISKDKGEIVFIHYNGNAPFKRDFAIELWLVPYNLVRIALPKFESREALIKYAEISIDKSDNKIRTHVFEDITEIAKRNLEDHYPRLIRRAIARLAIKEGIKYGTRRMAKNKDEDVSMAGTLLSLGTTIAGYITETADKRSWRLLPAEIGLAKVNIDPGIYNLHIEFKSKNGQIIKIKEFNNIEVKKGKKTFLSYRTYE